MILPSRDNSSMNNTVTTCASWQHIFLMIFFCMYHDDRHMQIYKHVKLAGRSNVSKIIFSEYSCNNAGSGIKPTTGQTSQPPATSGWDVPGTGH